MKKTTGNKKILACNDNHIVHHFITICSFILTKDYLVVLGLRWFVGGGAEVIEGGECGEVGCSCAFVTSTKVVFEFLRVSAGAALSLQLQEVAPRCWSQFSVALSV